MMNSNVANIGKESAWHMHQKHIEAVLKMWFIRSCRFILPIGCSAALLCWMFHKVDFNQMMAVIRHGVNYWWILAMMAFTVLSYNIRAARWGLQLDAVGIHASYTQLSVSIYGAYALNLMFTGLGEAWRCLYISKTKKASISTVVGTDIGDRATDAIAVIAILLATLVVAQNAIYRFAHKYAIGADVEKFTDNPWMWGVIVLVIGILWSIGHFCKSYKLVDSIDGCLDRIWSGFRTVFTLKHKWEYLWLTVGIWICYFLQLYVAFFAFPFAHYLVAPEYCYGLTPALVALMFCSMSMAIPSSGGLGPWNLALIFAVSLYGIGSTSAAAMAMVAWSAQAVAQVLVGIFSLIYLSRQRS